MRMPGLLHMQRHGKRLQLVVVDAVQVACASHSHHHLTMTSSLTYDCEHGPLVIPRALQEHARMI